jgi:predicted glutamine amidotransferase
MMAHIRYATQGAVSLENVHPFSRVWKGVQICFCHNGDCPKFSQGLPLLGNTEPSDIIYHPVGDTDSEAVFCAILNALAAEFPHSLPTLPVLHEFLAELCREIVANDASTIFNFLLGCGEYTLFAFSWPGQRCGSQVWNGLHYIVREPPFTTAKLLDVDYTINFEEVTTSIDRVAVITTKPLTEEPGWTEFKKGELLMFDKGKPYRTPKCCEIVEAEGRGLSSKWLQVKCQFWKAKAAPQVNGETLDSSIKAKTILTSPILARLPSPVRKSKKKSKTKVMRSSSEDLDADTNGSCVKALANDVIDAQSKKVSDRGKRRVRKQEVEKLRKLLVGR